ncbi:MAG: rhomboid family intramembrane serine protease [Desulfobacterales bacterium]|nr:rhomboid family intramembrane serine protease [Desulfobacterales bacterium]
MLIVPITGKISWKNPPAVTITIIFLNILVFFLFQVGDGLKSYKAQGYYFSSGLSGIEIPEYRDYVEVHGMPEMPVKVEDIEKEQMDEFYYVAMQMDQGFQEKLHNDEIITNSDDEYENWKELRNNYDDKMSGITSMEYGFRPAYKKIVTAFTYMFLHGGFMHLLGNMVFLWLVGCLLEMGCGRVFYLILYVFTGVASAAFFWMFNQNSMIPLVGASGAISGAMGAFAVMFGTRKVKVFYSLGVYFNYLKVPGFILLVLWLGNELYQVIFGEMSQVAYLAHIGGLLSGAGLGFIGMKLLGIFNEDVIREEPVDELTPLLEAALKKIRNLDMEGARPILVKALSKDPDNVIILTHLFNVDKLNPESPGFKESTEKLLAQLTISPATFSAAMKIYEAYKGRAKDYNLPPNIYSKMVQIYAESGQVDKALDIIKILIKKWPDFQGLPTAFLKMANVFKTEGMKDERIKYLKIILEKYPDSTEAQIAKKVCQINM